MRHWTSKKLGNVPKWRPLQRDNSKSNVSALLKPNSWHFAHTIGTCEVSGQKIKQNKFQKKTKQAKDRQVNYWECAFGTVQTGMSDCDCQNEADKQTNRQTKHASLGFQERWQNYVKVEAVMCLDLWVLGFSSYETLDWIATRIVATNFRIGCPPS